ncbi:MAG: NAD(P)/FAD-dependent oxidoreductase [Spirochaetales bacterium]|nr:NAD(P)/FAD-dependent oxidoreductase [Spirochaetales bacterium]
MKKIIIIGAGIAGMSVGIYARKNGYDVTIYEMHSLPGGMCTAWKRKGFTFEGCLHFMGVGGTSPFQDVYRIWKELGVLPGTKMIYHEVINTHKDTSGRTLNFYTDIHRLEKELRSLSSADKKEIKTLCKAAQRCSWFIRSSRKNPLLFLLKAVNILRGIMILKKYGEFNVGEYAVRFQDPLIRDALTNFFVYPDIPCVQIFFFLAMFHLKSIGYPEGSSLSFAKKIEGIFCELNGKIEYKKKVKRINVTDGRVTGIELDDGTVKTADIIISACDGHSTLFDMLGDRFTTPAIRERYATQPLYQSFIQVSLGVNRDMTGISHAVKVEVETPFEIAGELQKFLWYQHYAFDPTLSPKGKTAITILYPSQLNWWEKIGYRNEKYNEEKKKILDSTISQLEQVLPGISGQIEISDVATPLTTVRYTNNWKASLGFMLTKKIIKELMMNPQYTLPGIDNFYMIGQWVKGMSLIMAAESGKDVVKKICETDHIKFK